MCAAGKDMLSVQQRLTVLDQQCQALDKEMKEWFGKAEAAAKAENKIKS